MFQTIIQWRTSESGQLTWNHQEMWKKSTNFHWAISVVCNKIFKWSANEGLQNYDIRIGFINFHRIIQANVHWYKGTNTGYHNQNKWYIIAFSYGLKYINVAILYWTITDQTGISFNNQETIFSSVVPPSLTTIAYPETYLYDQYTTIR